MQLPLIKDGLVVNVVEIDEDTITVDKAEHRNLVASEEDDYQVRYTAWRSKVDLAAVEIRDAELQLFMARGAAAAMKNEARANGAHDSRHIAERVATKVLDRILVADAEVEAWEAKVADMKAKPMPEKPRMVRTPRWIRPDDHIVGPSGGHIGDAWNGVIYIPPEGKSAPAAETEAA